ncbi:MAG: hypothetical protein COB56_09280, partial [Robiginitomaculum sp.]
MSSAYENAVNMQSMAAAPDKSIFVSANAGSGKTRVLVERVSRILLTGTSPDKIMCLTYTKAAAAEMQTRLFQSLGAWSIMSEDKLTDELNRLEGNTDTHNQSRSQQSLNRARSLFARALETPGGLKVQTIHAFCERLLKRFPLEAGIAPGSDAVDEHDASTIQKQVWIDIETEAVGNPDGKLAQDIALLAAHKSDQDMDKLYTWAMGNAYKIDKWQEAGGTDDLAALFEIDADCSPETIMKDAWEAAPIAQLRAAVATMMNGGKTDQTKAGYIIAALGAPTPEQAFSHYVHMFFTKAGTPNISMVTAKAGDVALSIFGDKKSGYGQEALRMIAANAQLKSAHVLQLTTAVYNIAVLAVAKYRAIKHERRVMDFDDQIYLARNLLMNREASEWVRYKL